MSRVRHAVVALLLAGIGSAALPGVPASVMAVSSGIVISQVYGGGGNAGATLTNDFIELYNRGAGAIDVTGWTVQYASTTGTTWQSTPLAGTIGAGAHYLVAEGPGAGGTVPLPAPDATGGIALSATAGKVALVSSSAVLSGACPAGVVDLLGYGSGTSCAEGSPTASLTNTTAALRKGGGTTDTDDNAADFVVGAPNPRNSDGAGAPPVASNVRVALRQGSYLSGSGLPAAVSATCTDGSTAVAAPRQVERSTNGSGTWTRLATSSVTLASSGTVQFRVRCGDSSGAWGDWAYSPSLAPRLVQQTSSSVKYGKTWSSQSGSGFSGGSTRYHRTAGASAAYRATAYSIAWVTTRASNRGKAKAYLDGVYRKTIDTRLARTRYRYLGYAASWSTSAAHTLKLVVAGTAGRPRVDVDAFAVLLPALAGTVSGTPAGLLAALPTAGENGTGYDRTLFVHWIDADGDGCDTRREVLIDESTTPVTVGDGCALSGGTWYSAYDGVTTSDPADLDIDHMVPLKEAWDSGAYGWSAARREAYANDLGDPRTLRAVTSSSNSSKSDSDPAQWLPPLVSFRCQYADEWVAVKVRWQLSVDTAERSELQSLFATCPAPTMSVTIQ